METTKTEALLRQAKAICQEVTGREDVSDDLLCSVFRRLELEADLVDDDLLDALDAAQQAADRGLRVYTIGFGTAEGGAPIEQRQPAKIAAVVQPGGSVRDPEVIAAAEQAGVSMYFTGTRHFFH